MPRISKVLTGGVYFGEGPRWHEGRLWFSDFFAHAVKSASVDGEVRTELELDDQPSGLGWTPEGELLVVSMKKRLLLKRGKDGQVRTHADLTGIATWHCNDMAVDAKGRAYVGNFGFDLDTELQARGAASVLAEHVAARLALVEVDGTVTPVADDMHFPNGAVITPDGKTLIIAETFAPCLTAFDIDADGRLSNRRVWAALGERIPDGICLDAEGAIWVANPMVPECVRICEGGEVLDVVHTTLPCFACMLGGEDGRTLFMMTAPSSLSDDEGREPDAGGAAGKIEIAVVDAPHAGRP